MIIPDTLYRGDGDYRNERELKTMLTQDLVKTNLVNGGIGREIFEMPLVEHIQNHVNDNWKKTHFLSFSEDFDRAIAFGKGRKNENNGFDTWYDDEERYSWDFVILTLKPNTLLGLREVGVGIYTAHFIPGTKRFLPTYNLILIDVVKSLLSHNQSTVKHQVALSNARRDKEWLIFPAYVQDFGPAVEFSGLLDCNVFSEISRYYITRK